jgi:hypothetical protein
MKKVSHKLSKYHLVLLCGITITASLLYGATKAHSGWLDKGLEMLKSPAGTTAQKALTSEEIGNGLKEALLVGSESVVSQLGQMDGFVEGRYDDGETSAAHASPPACS